MFLTFYNCFELTVRKHFFSFWSSEVFIHSVSSGMKNYKSILLCLFTSYFILSRCQLGRWWIKTPSQAYHKWTRNILSKIKMFWTLWYGCSQSITINKKKVSIKLRTFTENEWRGDVLLGLYQVPGSWVCVRRVHMQRLWSRKVRIVIHRTFLPLAQMLNTFSIPKIAKNELKVLKMPVASPRVLSSIRRTVSAAQFTLLASTCATS